MAKQKCLNPLKRVNSILTWVEENSVKISVDPLSQSPQTGQFNSYTDVSNPYAYAEQSQSPQTGQFNSYEFVGDLIEEGLQCLNPLKRVNSILTTFVLPS